ncbi:MAG TPA: hypothetical protein VF432_19660 [Thermoanaerobaculia bacterium]
MAHGRVVVTPSGADPSTLTIGDVGQSGDSTIQWVPEGVTIESITFLPTNVPVPVPGATAPSAANNWTLTFPNPPSQVKWPYLIHPLHDGPDRPPIDPEIDNVG